ncbi:MAG TPA: hypothetical protein VKV02_08090 [Acidobacteriaceae bacterium]|nr:hypothetical protein [Acidobacteriaceae bacterium]
MAIFSPNLRRMAAQSAGLLVLFGSLSVARPQAVPTDASGGCPIPAATVAGMFQSGTVTLNGVAKAADSTQSLVPDCGFFQWAEQMYLWVTSPAPASYGGGSRIMFSPKFYTVTPEVSGRRQFLVNQPGRPLVMALRKTELGPHNLPSLISKSGHVIEVQPAPAGKAALPMVRLENGQQVQLGSVQKQPDGTLRFLDKAGATVQVQKLNLPTIVRQRIELTPEHPTPVVPVQAFQTAILARKFVLNKIPIFLDGNGNVIDVEPGQADNGVLLSQGNSLIYYITAVNDVYAFHRSMQIPGVIPPTTTINFPMTSADANAVKTFAAGKGHTIPEPLALAVETKSSWIEATAVMNPGDYLQETAVVPTYNKTSPDTWTPSGQKTVKLVMVGIHVVGSTNGHGEMVWASFEHLGNAPDAMYTYASTSGAKNVPQNTSGTWIFTPSGSTGPFNVTHATLDPMSGSINGVPATMPIANTPVLRMKAWGSDPNDSFHNTEVISANASILSQLKAGDVRRNYFQIGTTWTTFGQAPNGGNEVGTNQLANATIETFQQASSPTSSGSNCFDCHVTNHVAVSHVYRELQPLP